MGARRCSREDRSREEAAAGQGSSDDWTTRTRPSLRILDANADRSDLSRCPRSRWRSLAALVVKPPAASSPTVIRLREAQEDQSEGNQAEAELKALILWEGGFAAVPVEPASR
jgi:hypothetical protein